MGCKCAINFNTDAIQSFTISAHLVSGQQKNDAVLTISTHDAVVIMSETQKFVIQLK